MYVFPAFQTAEQIMSKRSVASPAPLSLVKRRRAHHQPHGAPKEHKVCLERIVGLTCVTSNGLTVSADTGCVAYPAGCVAVLHFPKSTRQLHIHNSSKKPISSVCLSSDGKYLAIGEYGHQPSVQVWNVVGSPNHVAELKAHKFGIECMAFSPSMKYMVSVGYQHDMHIHVWNWRTGHSVATNKITSKVYGLSFSEDGKYFVTVGNRRVRFWKMHLISSSKDENHTAPLKGRSAILGDLQDNCFVAVGCGRGSIASFTYVLTRSGVLCKFDQDRALDQFVNVQASAGRSLSLCESYVICGCGEGVVRLFDPCTLDYLLTMPLPHPLGVDVSVSLDTSQLQQEGGKFPDAVALSLDNTSKRLSVVYSDHSHYLWDIHNLRQIGKLHSSLHHKPGALPVSCLVTCSTDSTVRFWAMDTPNTSGQQGTGGSSLVKNIYSKELVRIIYASSDLSSLNDTSKYPGDASAVADTQRGVRCVQFHPRGHQLATGDRAGNIRVYEMQFMDVVFDVEAHIAEVLCIEYSPEHDGLQFMCSASRDRLIHVFTVADHYQHIQTIDDHSASITAIRFTVRKTLQLLSCGADKSIMFRTLQKSPSLEFQRSSHIACKASIYDMDIDVVGKHMVTAGQDRILRVYQLPSGKQKAVIKASTGDEGSLIKVAMDPSGLYVATSSSDKTVSLFDFYSGECLAKLYGHSEVVTQVKFSADCKFLFSVSADGCIFIWRLSVDITQTMHDRLAEIGTPVTPIHPSLREDSTSPIKAQPTTLRRDTYSVSKATDTTHVEVDSTEDAQFRLSVGQLPGWAQRQVQARPSIAQSFSTTALEKAGSGGGVQGGEVEGCWAQRVPKEALQFPSPNESISSATAIDRNRAASAPDVTIIDLTDSPETDSVPGKNGRTDEDEETEVFYLPLTSNIDPSVFKVTTPEKKKTDSVQEEEEDEDSSGSSNPSPVEVKDFLKTNFESLSAKQADDFFSCTPPDPHDPRLSISARFFSQSGRLKLPPWSQHITLCRKSWSSPDLPLPVQAGLVQVVEETGSAGQGRGEIVQETVEGLAERGDGVGGGEGDGEAEGEREREHGEPGEGELDGAAVLRETEVSVRENRDKQAGRECVPSNGSGEAVDKVTKRSPAIQEEIDKTKKRLRELGYDAMAKTPVVTASGTEATAATAPPQSPPPPISTHMSHPSQSSHTCTSQISTKKVKSKVHHHSHLISNPTTTDKASLTESSLLSRVKQCIAGINEGFRNMVALHQQVTEGLSTYQKEEGGDGGRGRQDCEEAMSAIATAVNSLKSRSVSLANKHRRRWRDLAQQHSRNGGSSPESSGSSRESMEGGRGTEGEIEGGRGGTMEAEIGGGEKGLGGRGCESGEMELPLSDNNTETQEVAAVEDRGGEGGGGDVMREQGERGGRAEGGTGDVMLEQGERGDRGEGGAGDVMMEPEVLELLERYSHQLVEMVRERTLQLPAD